MLDVMRSHDDRDRRFPPWVYRHGVEPDPRFSLANERTFLAWVRTSLALLAAGVALAALNLPVNPGLQMAAAGVFIGMSLLAIAQAWFGWARIERSLRLERELPPAAVAPFLAGGILIATVLLVVGYVTRGV